MVTTALLEFSFGRVPTCTCGHISLWTGTVYGPENSQQISDWYTPSHLIHGILFFAILAFFFSRTSIGFRLILATLLEATWEVFENSQFIIDRYRSATLAVGYNGDSVLNSISDITAMLAGFFLARYLPWWVTVIIVVFFELFVGYMIHDNLTLNIIMLIHPVDAIKVWQANI
jgi:hypothetical protein